MEESNAYSLFVYAINTPATRVKYEGRLRKFFDFIEIQGTSLKERCVIFYQRSKGDTGWATENIINFLQKQKERAVNKEISGATVRNYVKTIKLFCEMSEILVAWKKITRGLPKAKKYANDRAPTLEEIKRIMEYPDRRMKAIVSLMTSSGVRLGAWDYLRWDHIKPIERNGKLIAAKVIVYAEEVDEYFSFITPEAYKSIEEWMSYRQYCGELINADSWVMRDLWDIAMPKGKGLITMPKKLKSTGIKRLVERALWAQGLRKKLPSGKKRHEFQADHGFRKWFKTVCELAGVESINIEQLMGHSIGISDSYYRPTEEELLRNYLKAISSLTISDENRLQEHVEELTEKTKDNDHVVKAKLQEKDEELKNLKEMILSIQQEQKEMRDSLRMRNKLLDTTLTT